MGGGRGLLGLRADRWSVPREVDREANPESGTEPDAGVFANLAGALTRGHEADGRGRLVWRVAFWERATVGERATHASPLQGGGGGGGGEWRRRATVSTERILWQIGAGFSWGMGGSTGHGGRGTWVFGCAYRGGMEPEATTEDQPVGRRPWPRSRRACVVLGGVRLTFPARATLSATLMAQHRPMTADF